MALWWEIDWKLLRTLYKRHGIAFACCNHVFGLRSVRPRHTLTMVTDYGGGIVHCFIESLKRVHCNLADQNVPNFNYINHKLSQ